MFLLQGHRLAHLLGDLDCLPEFNFEETGGRDEIKKVDEESVNSVRKKYDADDFGAGFGKNLRGAFREERGFQQRKLI